MSNDPVEQYVLTTVTYGTACVPYLSLRMLKQLFIDEGNALPEAIKAVTEELYVNDFLSGDDTVEPARIRWDQIVKLLKAGGCILKKWVTYDSNLREDIPPKDRLRPTFLQMSAEGPANELGVTWDTHQD